MVVACPSQNRKKKSTGREWSRSHWCYGETGTCSFHCFLFVSLFLSLTLFALSLRMAYILAQWPATRVFHLRVTRINRRKIRKGTRGLKKDECPPSRRGALPKSGGLLPGDALAKGGWSVLSCSVGEGEGEPDSLQLSTGMNTKRFIWPKTFSCWFTVCPQGSIHGGCDGLRCGRQRRPFASLPLCFFLKAWDKQTEHIDIEQLFLCHN